MPRCELAGSFCKLNLLVRNDLSHSVIHGNMWGKFLSHSSLYSCKWIVVKYSGMLIFCFEEVVILHIINQQMKPLKTDSYCTLYNVLNLKTTRIKPKAKNIPSIRRAKLLVTYLYFLKYYPHKTFHRLQIHSHCIWPYKTI